MFFFFSSLKASTSRAHDRAPPRPSQGRRRGGGGHSASQRAPDSDGEEAGFINIDLLIDEVREREPLWNMADRRHADSIVTRRLWDEVCHAAIEGWGELNSRGQKKARDKLQKRWRSIRDRFKKELNQEMQAPSGSGGRRSKYRYFRALSFLRTTMVCRSTVCSTREPASNPTGAIPEQSATGEHTHRPHPSEPSLPSTSVPSTCAGASRETSLPEAAGDEIAFPLPHPSDTAALSRTPLGSGRQRHRGQEKSYAPEFLHLNAAFQNAIQLLAEQNRSSFSFINANMEKNTHELCTRLDRLHLDASKSPNHCFFQAVLERMEKLSPDQQMHVMQATRQALAQVSSQPPPPTPPPAPAPPPAIVPTPPAAQYQPAAQTGLQASYFLGYVKPREKNCELLDKLIKSSSIEYTCIYLYVLRVYTEYSSGPWEAQFDSFECIAVPGIVAT
ncbi:uncharacterized protein LOC142303159 [Anomaloglossus baeobatrachus]|uniref:uncharacterized protein LOC142303159 n=1 Tax=Anomaloglossus baeobatrachus TaxID=238106 RepID=UPI003F50B839